MGIILGLLVCIWAYICALIVFRKIPLWKLTMQMSKVGKLQQKLDELNIRMPVQRYQVLRFAIFSGWIASSLMISGFQITPLIAIAFGIWFLTGSSGLGFIMKLKKKFIQFESKRDGQLIAFARLYELQQRTKKMQLPAFCRYSADFLPMLRNDLVVFAQRLTTDGDRAFEWFETRFPSNHLFLHRLLSTIRSIENGAEDKRFGKLIDELAQDHYLRKKKAISPILNTLISLPTALVILMIVVLLMQYITITKNTITLQ